MTGATAVQAPSTTIDRRAPVQPDRNPARRAGSTGSRGGVADEEFARAGAAGLADEELAEIIAHVALNVLTNYFNRAAQAEIDFPKVSTGQRISRGLEAAQV